MKRILIFACLIGAAVSCREQQPVEPVVLDDTFAIEQPTPGTVLARRNTGGLIDPMLKEISPNAVAYLMNALYFKAR